MTQTSTQLHLTACLPLQLTTSPRVSTPATQLPAQTPQGTPFRATSQASPFPGSLASCLTLPQREAKGRGLGEFSRELLGTIFTFPVPSLLLPAPPSELGPCR